MGQEKGHLHVGVGHADSRLHMGQAIQAQWPMLGSGTSEDAVVKSPPQKMHEEVKRQVVYWQTEFDMDKWSVAGVLFDIAMDLLMIIELDAEEEEVE